MASTKIYLPKQTTVQLSDGLSIIMWKKDFKYRKQA